ncbi:MAG: hypothetical protein ABEJ02_00445 [Candidatus Paceibacteria bacterium]
MKTRQRSFITTLVMTAASVLAMIQLTFLSYGWIGILVVAVFLGGSSILWHDILVKVFRIKRGKIETYILGGVLSFFLWGFLIAIFIIFYQLSIWTIPTSMVVVTAASYFLNKYITQNRVRLTTPSKSFSLNNYLLFTAHNSLLYLYGLIWVAAAYFLSLSGGSQVFHTPWHSISETFVYLFLLLTIILGAILLSKHRSKVVLMVIIAHSLLVHAYLPVSHNQPWGGDVWRHIGFEKILQSEQPIRPTLFNEDIKTVNIASLQVPELFTHSQKFSYSFSWGVISSLGLLLKIPLTVLHKWLLPVLWSVAVPIILFQIGLVLYKSVRQALFLSVFSLIPFSFQALGSITLPVSFGYLSFFMLLLMWLLYLQDRFMWQKGIVFGFSTLMLFGYPLHGILIWLLIGLTLCWEQISALKNKAARAFTKSSLLVVSILSIPSIELATKINKFGEFMPISSAIDFLKLLSGYQYTQIIKGQDTLIGNILVNHTPSYAFLSTFFTVRRYHVFIFSTLILLAAVVGVYKIAKSKREAHKSVGLLTAVAFGGYFISWYFFDGDHLLTRRLDVMLAFVLGMLSISGFWFVLGQLQEKISKPYLRTTLAIVVILASLFTTTSYISGPDMRVVSDNEQKVAQYIWEQKHKPECVLADTWVLLRLRAFSAGQVIGGGFPIGKQFSQPERVRILKQMKNKPNAGLLRQSRRLTDSEKCWLVFSKDQLSESEIEKINKIVGSNSMKIDEFLVWKEDN